jgi:hypothetical protein
MFSTFLFCKPFAQLNVKILAIFQINGSWVDGLSVEPWTRSQITLIKQCYEGIAQHHLLETCLNFFDKSLDILSFDSQWNVSLHVIQPYYVY